VNANDAAVHGIVRATKNAVVNLADANNLKLTSDYLEEYGITPVLEADVGGNVIVGNTTGKTEIIGDVFAHDGGQVDIILVTAGSVLEGTTNIKLPEGVPNEDGSNEEGIVNLTLSNGATWSSFDDSYVTTLTMANGVVKMFGNGQTITVDSLNGIGDSDATGTILVTDFSNRLDVNKADKGSTLTVAYDGTYETIVDKKALILEGINARYVITADTISLYITESITPISSHRIIRAEKPPTTELRIIPHLLVGKLVTTREHTRNIYVIKIFMQTSTSAYITIASPLNILYN
jgi:hypothetical protein